MNNAVAGATVRPHQEQQVLTGGQLLHVIAELFRRFYWLAVKFQNDIASRQASIFCWACRLYLRYGNTLHV